MPQDDATTAQDGSTTLIIKSKKSIYNLRADMKNEKFDGTQSLKATDGSELPEYVKMNKTKYSNWIE